MPICAFSTGDERYITSEDDEKTYRVKLDDNGRLTAEVFAERGGTSVVADTAGNAYIASGQACVYNREGKQFAVLELPERPGSLAFGGPDRRTWFVGARSSV